MNQAALANQVYKANIKNIFVIEDNYNISESLIDLLDVHQYKVALCTGGNQVTTTVLASEPDLILLDLDLFEGNGAEICRELRLFSNLPIILTSSKADYQQRLLAFQLGADDFIAKPFNTRELILRIKSVLKRSSA